MTTQTEIPMMDCPVRWKPSDGGEEFKCCSTCQGTGQVPDTAKMDMDIAKAEKDCDGNGCVNGKQLIVSKEPGKTREEDCWTCRGTGRVPLLPGLREDCHCSYEGNPGNRNQGNVDSPIWKPCELCQGRTWVPNVSTDTLMAALNLNRRSILLSDWWNHETKTPSFKAAVDDVWYIHADPYIALLGATWKALNAKGGE